MGAGTNAGKGAGYNARMPNPAVFAMQNPQYGSRGEFQGFAGKYPSLSNANLAADVATQPATSLSSLYAGAQKPAYGMAGYGQGLEMNPYNPAMTKPAMVGGFQLPNSWGGIGGPTGGLQGGGKGGGKGGGGRMPPAAAFSGAVPPPNGRATGWVD